MKKIFITSLFVILLTGSFMFAQTAAIDSKAPNFTLKDSKGNTHSLSDFAGKTVVLEWINYDCPFVKKHYDGKNMQKLQKEYAEKGVIWLAICSSAPGKQGNFSIEEITKRSNAHGFAAAAYLIDEDGKVGKLYDAKTTPHMYVINPEGNLVYAGAIDSISSSDKADIDKAEKYVVNALNSVLAGEAVTTKTTKPYGCSVKY